MSTPEWKQKKKTFIELVAKQHVLYVCRLLVLIFAMCQKERLLLKIAKCCLFFSLLTTFYVAFYKFPCINNVTLEGGENAAQVVNVMLLTYPRSGSSLTGELLTTVGNYVYFFEPLFYACDLLNACSAQLLLLNMLHSCDERWLDTVVKYNTFPIVRVSSDMTQNTQLSQRSAGELVEQCRATNYRISKTTRLRIPQLLQLLREKEEQERLPNLRVIHLLRDPRARYYSLQERGDKSEEEMLHMVCDQPHLDLLSAHLIPSHAYLRVRYEDLVSDPQTHLAAIFKHAYGMDMPNSTWQYVSSHMGSAHSTVHYNMHNLHEYYSTYRKDGVDLERWRKNLTPSAILKIQQRCRFVMKELNYSLI